MATKSNKSSGSQHNPKGVTQGVTLVDPKSGNPIDTVLDTNGLKRLAVDANFTAQNVQANVELDYNEDSVEIGDSNTGSTLKINTDGSIDANVEVDAGDGDNVGLKVQERNLSPADTKYSKRVTAITGTGNNSDSTSLDVSLHDENGNSYTAENPLFINSVEIVKFLKAPLDFFGNTSVSTRTNQIEVPLDDVNYVNYVDFINVSTGSISQANGQVTLTTGTNANGRYAMASKDFVRYRPNSEIGWGFTWSIPTPSTTNVTIRIGATDDVTNWTNGVYFQHENGTFSLVYKRNGSVIFNAPSASWLDPCSGPNTAYVNFLGVAQTLDISKDQLARVRAGLFGHAGFIVELLAPNQTWVKIYEYGNINTADVSIFGTFDLKVGAEVKKVNANAGVYLLRSACWAGWTGSSLTRVSEPITDRTLSQVTRTIIEGKTTAGGGNYVPVKVNPSGALTISIGDLDGVKGQKTMAESMPVVIASDQTSFPTYFDETKENRVNFKASNKDAYSRLIVAEPIELASHDHRISKLPRYFDEAITGSATSVHNPISVSVDMITGTGATDSVIRQSFRQFEYTRGNAEIGKFSLNPGGAGKIGNQRLWGLGDSENGIFWGIDANGLKVVRRTKTSGIVVDETVYQNNFNGDKLNGTGLSGANINLSTQNLFLIMFSWLGTNIIQMRFAYRGEQIIAHTFYPGNNETTAWSQSGSLPVRYENKNTQITTPTTMKVVCSAVFTVGSSKEISTYSSFSTGTGTISITPTPSVVAGIRLRPDIKYVGINPESYDILPISGTGVVYYKIILRPTLTGANWSNYSEITQILTNNPTYTANSGYVIQEGYANLSIQGRNAVEIPAKVNSTLGYSLTNEPDALIILMQTTTGNGTLYFAGAFREIY
jgi:hypothetical protein